jgi:hypothetical protein
MRGLWIVACAAAVSVAEGQSSRAIARYAIGTIDTTEVPSSLALFDAMDVVIADAAPRVARLDSGNAMVASIRQRTNWLRGRWRAAKPTTKTDPVGFRQSLAYDVAVVRAAASDTSARQLLAVLRDVNDDVVEKAQHCAKSPSGMATPVKVSVRTWSGKAESPNWQILYIPKIMEFAADPSAAAMPFRVFSSPAVEELAPGRYVVWARRPGSDDVVGARTTIRVGGGAATLSQDIPVPQ